MRILGIDVGSSTIKAIELDSAFGRYDIHDYHEVAIELGGSAEASVQQLIKQLTKAPDRIIVSIPQKFSTFRNLQLPTRDKKSIQSGIRFELEDDLPFPTDSYVSDYTLLSQNKSGSWVHVAATLKSHVASELQFWQNSGVEVDLMTTQFWAHRTLFNRIVPATESETPVLYVRIGRENSQLYIHWRNAPIVAREVNWGSGDLTRAIMDKFQVPELQAESMKRGQGSLLGELTPEQKEISQCIATAFEPLMTGLRKVEIACKSLTSQTAKLVYLGGGGALIPGLPQWIENRISIPTKMLPALSLITTSGVTYSEQTDARFILALGLCLCLVGPDRATCINFRKGEFGKEVRTRELNFKILKKPLLAVGAVAASLMLSLIVQSAVYKSRLETTNIQLEKNVRTFFGQLSNSALKTYLANTTTLKSSLQKELNKQRELSRLFGANPKSPLDFLKHLSTSVPKDVIVDLISFQEGSPANEPFSAKQVSASSLTFTVSNPQVAEKLTQILAGKFENFQKGRMEEVSSSGDAGKKWKFTLSGKPIEDVYGK